MYLTLGNYRIKWQRWSGLRKCRKILTLSRCVRGGLTSNDSSKEKTAADIVQMMYDKWPLQPDSLPKCVAKGRRAIFQLQFA